MPLTAQEFEQLKAAINEMHAIHTMTLGSTDPTVSRAGVFRLLESFRERQPAITPPYNHTRGDSALAPCQICRDILGRGQ